MTEENLKDENPILYEEIKAKQEELKKKFSLEPCLARVCPYCHNNVSLVIKGDHNYTSETCPHCGETVIFPPVKFRRATSNYNYYNGYRYKYN